MAIGDEKSGTIASEVSTGTSGADGTRVSKDSDWTTFDVPSNCVINKDKTHVDELSSMGSEHSYTVEFYNNIEVVPGTGIMQPQSIRVKTHARSSSGPFGGGGGEKVKVTFYYVQFKN